MAIYATFVGVNTHADDGIKELSGAVADATAMWALFKDSVPDIQCDLLVNEDATTKGIHSSIETHLDQISENDTLIFYFAGHGSPDHHLVSYDTNRDKLSSTSIAMDTLSLWFSGNQSRTVIFLDCCFSGGATARVLDDVPVSRGGLSSVSDLQGNGRAIITASQSNEPALEINGHGLFTKALIDTFVENEDGVAIGQLTDDVTRRVRAEAERFGASQRPIIFNHLEDGLEFPPLSKGILFTEYFPDTSSIIVSSNMEDLLRFGLPESLINAWHERYPNGLNDLQLSSINDHRVLDGESLLTIAPTSSGKTFIGELAIAKAITQGRKAVFLLPYRALTNEKYEDFKSLYEDELGFRVIRCTGDYADNTDIYMRGQFDIALFTYEMFLNISIAAQETINQLGLVAIDEAQFVTDDTRGINVELLITNLLLQRKRGVHPQIVALSAVIGSINSFDEWLDCRLQTQFERPIPLIEGVIDRSGVYQYMDMDGEEKTEQFLEPYEIRQRRNKPSSQDVIVPIVQKLIKDDETIIVFRNNRGSTVGAANYLADSLNLPAAQEAIDSLNDLDSSTSSSRLISAMQGGACFHNSDLNRNERLVVEREFKKANSELKVMSATTTVAAGINTPASTVIIAEAFFWGDGGKKDFSVAEYKNMAGRAGRLGISDRGRSILIAETPNSRELMFQKYVRGSLEPLKSSFTNNNLDTWILRLLSQVNEVPRESIITLLANTFGGYLENRNNPTWISDTQTQLEALLENMIELELIEEIEGNVNLTLLGKACGKSSLSFSSSMQLVREIKNFGAGLTAMQLMGIIQVLPEVSRYTPLMRRGTRESQWAAELNSNYGHEVTRILQRQVKDNWEYYSRCKRAAIINQWIEGRPLDQIERHYSITPYQGSIGAGDIRGFADVTRLYLRAANEIADILLLGEGPDALEIDNLLKRLELGVPEAILPLTEVPITLLRGEYLALYNSGFTSIETVQQLTDVEISNYLTQESLKSLRQEV